MIVGGVDLTGACQSQNLWNKTQVSCSLKIQSSASITKFINIYTACHGYIIQENLKKKKKSCRIVLTSVPSLPGGPGGPGGPVAPLGPGLCTKKKKITSQIHSSEILSSKIKTLKIITQCVNYA